ncbi:MAG: zinc permease [Cytophagales bacterium]|nr:MAG: zinc permease [Cytophagales bacterium]
MYFNFILLFLCAFIAGMTVVVFPNISKKNFKTILSFSGAYLFSITVIHILPELFHEQKELTTTGIFVLGGFFLQMILELFTTGIEHGHIHNSHDHHFPKTSILLGMLVSLCFHAFLEGTLIIHPHQHDGNTELHQTDSLMFGLILHKIPESIALAAVLSYTLINKNKIIFYLVLFSLASPLGLLFSSYFYESHLFSTNLFSYLFAVVAGNFLYISTTIFFESSPDHQFKSRKLIVSFIGAFMAIVSEKYL